METWLLALFWALAKGTSIKPNCCITCRITAAPNPGSLIDCRCAWLTPVGLPGAPLSRPPMAPTFFSRCLNSGNKIYSCSNYLRATPSTTPVLEICCSPHAYIPMHLGLERNNLLHVIVLKTVPRLLASYQNTDINPAYLVRQDQTHINEQRNTNTCNSGISTASAVIYSILG